MAIAPALSSCTSNAMPDNSTPTVAAGAPNDIDIIQTAARATLSVLSSHKLHACLFGSAACAMYGMQHREPNITFLHEFVTSSNVDNDLVGQDVDVVVLTDEWHAEDLKQLLVSSEPRFHLVPSRNPNNTYRVLWFSLVPTTTTTTNDDEPPSCKVDILTPGLLGIPQIPSQHLVRLPPPFDIPVVPLLPLIFLKLRGWTDHLASHLPHMQEKTWVDEEDIDEMLCLAVEVYGASLEAEEEKGWMPDWFVEEGRERAEKYARAFLDSFVLWREMGVPVEDAWDEDDDDGAGYCDEDDYDD